NVVDEISREIAGSAGKWNEVAGILLGRKESEDCPIIVEDRAALPRGNRANGGPAYTDPAIAALQKLGQRWGPLDGRRMPAVGLYRSAVAGAPSITREDVQLFDHLFPEPGAVFLFIYASRRQLLATLLSREDGRLASPWERPSFLFERRELAENTTPRRLI